MWVECHSFMTVSVTLTHRMAFSNMCKFLCLSLMDHFISQTVSLGEVTKLSVEKGDEHSSFPFSFVSLASCSSSTIVPVATAFDGKRITKGVLGISFHTVIFLC